MEDFQVEVKEVSSEKNIAVSKMHNLTGIINEITENLITRINIEKATEKIYKLKLMI